MTFSRIRRHLPGCPRHTPYRSAVFTPFTLSWPSRGEAEQPVLESLAEFHVLAVSRASSRSAGAGRAEADTCVPSEQVGAVSPCPLQCFPLHPMPFERRASHEAWRSCKRAFGRTRRVPSGLGRRSPLGLSGPSVDRAVSLAPLTPVAPGVGLDEAHLPTHLCGLKSHPPSWAALSTTSSERPPVLCGVMRPPAAPPDRVLLCPSVSGAAASLLPPRLLAGLQAMAVPLMHLPQDSARGLTHSQGVVAPGGCA